MPEMNFEGTATWKGATECELSIKGKKLVTVSPPPSFGGKEGYCVPEDIFAAALASCINTLVLLIAKNSQLGLKNLETIANVKMNVEGMEKLIFHERPLQHERRLGKRQRTRTQESHHRVWDGAEDLSDSAVVGRSRSNKL